MSSPLPLTRELVLIGGGHTHALVLRKWGMDPLPGVRLTLINTGPAAPYTGMLPGHVAGHYRRHELMIDLVRLARFAGARLILGEATGIDRAARLVQVSGRGPVAYDLGSVNVGITSGLPALPGFAEHGVGAKPLGPFAAAWRDFRAAVRAGEAKPEIVVIGGGVGGVELSMAMAHALRQEGVADATITVIERDRALPGLGDGARAAILANLDRLGVTLREGAEPQSVDAGGIMLTDGARIPAGFVVGAAGARPQPWLTGTGLDLTDGFVTVDRTLRSSDPAIYAAGDCAHLGHTPRPKAGVFAVREAPVLYRNLRAELTGSRRRRYAPQRDYLKLISLGDKAAVADKFGLRLEGRWLWRWKDRIDRRFMRRFIDLPAMPGPILPRAVASGVREALEDGKPMCGGCGSKVGGGTLARVLDQLPAPATSDILSRPGDDAAVLQIGGRHLVWTTDHLRAFTLDPWIMALIAAVHALGDVWAMGATPQAALATVILPPMTDRLQESWLTEIMAAAQDVFAEAGAAIAGGHTSLGDELTIGFSVTGLCTAPPITLAGAKPGDALLLTKPIGSGTILAAEMALAARGRWVAEALQAMTRPQGAAAAILADAHAMTDVTGFGLAGHLLNLCDASGVAAEIALDAVPLVDGAEALAAQGIRSTIYPQNRQAAARMAMPQGPRADLLFDPQTAGGLLAAVEGEMAEALLDALRAADYPAALIGRIKEGVPFITVR